MAVKELKVLICDDSMLIRKQMKESLEKLGVLKVFEAGDGDKAVSKYAETNPDVVFMDIVMPGKTGVDALKDIKSIDPAAKVVIVSSAGTKGNLKEAITAGAFDFVQKPIEEDVLLKMLEKAIKKA
ncbi:MAG: response regulator [Oscillospiraceae bacterium]|nr:response regulator [Oscillospiraceae bacterium]